MHRNGACRKNPSLKFHGGMITMQVPLTDLIAVRLWVKEWLKECEGGKVIGREIEGAAPVDGLPRVRCDGGR